MASFNFKKPIQLLMIVASLLLSKLAIDVMRFASCCCVRELRSLLCQTLLLVGELLLLSCLEFLSPLIFHIAFSSLRDILVSALCFEIVIWMVTTWPEVKSEGKFFALQILVILSDLFNLVTRVAKEITQKVWIVIAKIRKLQVHGDLIVLRFGRRASLCFRSVLIVPSPTEVLTVPADQGFSIDPELLLDLLDHILSSKNRQNRDFLWDLIQAETHPYQILSQIIKLINNIMSGSYIITPNLPNRHFFTEQYFIGLKLDKLLFAREMIKEKMEYYLRYFISDKRMFMEYFLDDLIWEVKYMHINPLERPYRVSEIEEIIEEVPAQQNLEDSLILDERKSKSERFFSLLPKFPKISKRKMKKKINKIFSCISFLWEESDDVKWARIIAEDEAQELIE